MDASFLPAAKPHSSLWDQCWCVPQYRALHFPSHGAFAFSHPPAFIVLGNREAGSWTAWAGVSEQAPSRCLCSQIGLVLPAFPAGLSCVLAGCRQSLWAAPSLPAGLPVWGSCPQRFESGSGAGLRLSGVMYPQRDEELDHHGHPWLK